MAQSTCSIEGCDARVVARGWCRKHYGRWYVKGSVDAEVRHRSATRPDRCSVEGCESPGWRREWCCAHYERWRNTGDPLVLSWVGVAAKEFERLVQIETDECVVWTRSLDVNGYGRLGVGNGKTRKVHQLALERRVGPRPDGMLACHRPVICHNPACLNYRHLYWGTNTDNMRDKILDGTSRWKENQRARGLP